MGIGRSKPHAVKSRQEIKPYCSKYLQYKRVINKTPPPVTNFSFLVDVFGDSQLLKSAIALGSINCDNGSFSLDDISIKTLNFIPTDYALRFLGKPETPTQIKLTGKDWYEDEVRGFYQKIQGRDWLTLEMEVDVLLGMPNLIRDIKLCDPVNYVKIMKLSKRCNTE